MVSKNIDDSVTTSVCHECLRNIRCLFHLFKFVASFWPLRPQINKASPQNASGQPRGSTKLSSQDLHDSKQNSGPSVPLTFTPTQGVPYYPFPYSAPIQTPLYGQPILPGYTVIASLCLDIVYGPVGLDPERTALLVSPGQAHSDLDVVSVNSDSLFQYNCLQHHYKFWEALEP